MHKAQLSTNREQQLSQVTTLEEARKWEDSLVRTIPYPKRSNEWYAEYQILHLQEFAEGFPEGYDYDGWSDYMHDFWPNFSWNEKRDDKIQLVLDDPRFPEIARKIKQNHGFDMKKELEHGLRDEF